MQAHLFSFIFQANFTTENSLTLTLAWEREREEEAKDKQATEEEDTFADDYILQQFIEI